MKRRGFTLLEVILVITFIAAVFFPMLQVISNNLVGSNETEKTYSALNFAQKMLEEVRGLPYNQIISVLKETIPGQSIFKQSLLVSEEAVGLKNVAVSIFWNIAGGEQNITIQTKIASGETQ